MADAREVLLRRQGLVFVEPQGTPAPAALVDAVELELANLRHVPSARLKARLAQLDVDALTAWSAWACDALAAALGTGDKLEPLFRSFPDGVPADTTALRWQRLLTYYLQGVDLPCLWCRRRGTTHVLSPCGDVVCDRCFDGASYSACPVCERAVDRGSPFFREPPVTLAAKAPAVVRFKLLDLGDDPDAAARALVAGFCARKQAMSPTDADDLTTLVVAYGARILPWLPETIPVKENVARVFGTLFRHGDPAAVLPVARRYLRTATDVLRLLAVVSRVDASLQGQVRWKRRDGEYTAQHVYRFRVARLARPVRRALLAVLEGFAPDALAEDMLRHRAAWVGVGERLHPHEYASRFPAVARAFQIVRGQAPDGTPAPPFRTFASTVERAAAARDARAMVAALAARPGELARRLDHALRLAGADTRALEAVVAAFVAGAPRMATPVLLTLRSHLPTRRAPLPVRVYFPSGAQAITASEPDRRDRLRGDAIGPARRAADAELLRRFAAKPAVGDAVIDRALADVMVPFNERTASRGAVALSRGTRLPVPASKAIRLFLHWCQPERGLRTDIDLSVAFYDEAWRLTGVCSYYQLQWQDAQGQRIAASAGDRQDAPWPEGATELVDVDRARARAAGARWAVMVVNAYAGLTFSELARGHAGLMLRDHLSGAHVDPRTVELKFDLAGEHGMFAPLALDLVDDTMHWLDVYNPGELQWNNVATSNRALTTVCPNLIAYFGSGVRTSMYDLALLHAAARAERVWLRARDGSAVRLRRGPGEDAATFLARLTTDAGEPAALADALAGGPVLAALVHGDLDLPDGSIAYALFRERVVAPIAAADLLS